MKGIILEHKKNGVQVMDQDGYFRFVKGHTDCRIGAEIEIPLKNIAKREQAGSRPLIAFRRPVLAGFGLACICLICLLAARWNVASYYVYIDAVDDVELAFNSLNIVISATGLNSEGTCLLEHEHLLGHSRKAVEETFLAMREDGFHGADPAGHEFLEITVSAQNINKAEAISKDLGKHYAGSAPVETHYDYCDLAKREAALNLGVTPCKLLLAEELNLLEPDLPLEEIITLSLDDIYLDIEYLSSQPWSID